MFTYLFITIIASSTVNKKMKFYYSELRRVEKWELSVKAFRYIASCYLSRFVTFLCFFLKCLKKNFELKILIYFVFYFFFNLT